MSYDLIAESVHKKVKLHYATKKQPQKPVPPPKEIIKYISKTYTAAKLDNYYIDMIAEGIIDKIDKGEMIIEG